MAALGLHDFEHLVLAAVVLPEQQAAAGLHDASLDVEHRVMAHTPGDRLVNTS